MKLRVVSSIYILTPIYIATIVETTGGTYLSAGIGFWMRLYK